MGVALTKSGEVPKWAAKAKEREKNYIVKSLNTN